MKVMPPISFLGKFNSNNTEIYTMIHTPFAVMKLFFPQIFHHFQHTNVAKYPASTSNHITSSTRKLITETATMHL
jgi:hypothetical protein